MARTTMPSGATPLALGGQRIQAARPEVIPEPGAPHDQVVDEATTSAGITKPSRSVPATGSSPMDSITLLSVGNCPDGSIFSVWRLSVSVGPVQEVVGQQVGHQPGADDVEHDRRDDLVDAPGDLEHAGHPGPQRPDDHGGDDDQGDVQRRRQADGGAHGGGEQHGNGGTGPRRRC